MDNKILTGLDIGTTKVCAVIVKEDIGEKLNVVGIGSAPSYGLRKGVVVNIEQTIQSVQQALGEAEHMAGVKVNSVFVGIAGDHIRGMNSKGVVGVARDDHEITVGDVDRAISAARALALPIDREILHVIPQEFIVDQQDGIPDPIGLAGVRLEVEVHLVTAAVTSAQNIVKSVQRAGYMVEEIVLEPLASSLSVLDDDEKNLGIALVDLGGGTTDIAMFFEGNIRHTSVVGLGGQNVTNDIAIGLRTPTDQAEIIKIDHACALSEMIKTNETLTVPGVGGRAPRVISRSVLTDIVQPRMEEILNLTYQEMEKTDLLNLMAAGVVITGGGAMLSGTIELAERLWGMPVKLGVPKYIGGLTESIRNPIYATAVGLTFYGHRYHEGDSFHKKRTDNLWEDVRTSITNFFKRFF